MGIASQQQDVMRPCARLDTFFLIFLSLHLVISLLVDAQVLPALHARSPALLRDIFALAQRSDPLLASAHRERETAWFRALVLVELVVHAPLIVASVTALQRGSAKSYPLLLAYGAANFPATLACLYALPALAKEHGMPLGPAAAPYVFFLVVPAAMVVYAGGVTLELVQ